MNNSKMIGGLAALLVLAGCVTVDAPAASSAAQGISFIPNTGMPAEAVVSVRLLPDSNQNVSDRVIVQFYPSKASQAQIDAAPEALCNSIGKPRSFAEFLPTTTSQAGPPVARLMVHCS